MIHTLNSEKDFEKIKEYGDSIDGIFTDRPQLFKEFMEKNN